MNVSWKRVLCLLLSAAMLMGTLSGYAYAEEIEKTQVPVVAAVEPISMTYINPLYVGVVEETDLAQPNAVALAENVEYCYTIRDAGEAVRKQLKARQQTVTVGLRSTTDADKSLLTEVFSVALAHTGDPKEGDYLNWQYGGWKGQISGYSDGAFYYLTLTYTVTYYTTAEQEAVMDTAVAELLGTLGLSGAGNYEKVKGVYDWICANVSYDHANLGDDTYKLKYTAYAALVNRTSVCQGYAVLLYRLLLELGVDNRVIIGTGNGGAHSWNIVALDGVYYNVDATWDAGRSEYSYFLKSDEAFGDHIRDSAYTTKSFYESYPMVDGNNDETTDPNVVAEGVCGDNVSWALSVDGSFVIDGTGEMWGYKDEQGGFWERPWEAYTDRIIKVSIGDGVTSVGAGAFRRCNNLETISFGNSIINIGVWAFAECASLQDFVLPESLAAIYQCAFDSCMSLTSIVIPANVQFLDGHIFANCENLRYVEIKSNPSHTVFTCADGMFENCNMLEAFVVEEGHVALCAQDGVLFSGNTLVQYPAGKKDTAWVVPDGTEEIFQGAFKRARYLEEVYVPGSVTKIDPFAFGFCENLKKVVLAEGVESIGMEAFVCCTNLSSVTIPSSVTTIDYGAFEMCDLSEIIFLGDAPDIGNNAFYNSKATAKYPVGNDTWTEDTKQQYGGTITWKPFCTGEHTYETVVTAPTCTKQGYTTHTCTLCGDCYVDRYKNALDHNLSEWVTVKEPTTIEEGEQERVCKREGCSYKETETLPVIPLWDVPYASMTLGNELAMNFAFAKGNVSDWDGCYAQITKTYADGREVTKVIPRSEWTSASIMAADDHFVISFNGIAAKEMCDTFYVTIYNAAGEPLSERRAETVLAYANRCLDNYKNDPVTRTMLVDMLTYGAAAQELFNYNMDKLANAGLTEEQKNWATASVIMENSLLRGKNYVGSSLVLEQQILMMMAFSNVTEGMYAEVQFVNHYNENVHVAAEMTVDGGFGIVRIDQIVVADARIPVTVTVYNADGSVHGSATDSVESYIERVSSKEPTNAELYEKILMFADSSYNFLHKSK